jgi:hypothetical protein
MPMPRQLRNAKRRSRHSEPRPTIELMPSININELRHVIPRYHGQVNEPNVDLKYPGIACLRLFTSHIEITGRNGYVQCFRIEWIPTHFGRHRAILVCSSCGGGAIRLFGHYGNYACRYCHRAVYASQKYDQFGRKRLQASKLRLTNSAVGQTFANHCHRKPNGSTKSATNAYAIKSKYSKHKPIKHASVSRSTFAPSLITSDDHAPPKRRMGCNHVLRM